MRTLYRAQNTYADWIGRVDNGSTVNLVYNLIDIAATTAEDFSKCSLVSDYINGPELERYPVAIGWVSSL